LVNEPTTTTYSDDAIRAIIEQYPLPDERGVDPYYYDTTTDPPTQVTVTGWYPSYDLHRAAADIWEEKAALEAPNFDYPANGIGGEGTHQHSQRYEHYMRMARFHGARAAAKTAVLRPSPSPNRRGNSLYVGNLPEDD